jgi:TolB-like protein
VKRLTHAWNPVVALLARVPEGSRILRGPEPERLVRPDEELGVAFAHHGSVRSGPELRKVSVRVFDAATGVIVW